MPTIRIPAPLRPYAGNNSTVRVGGTTAGSALEELTRAYPALRQHLYDGDTPRSFVNIFSTWTTFAISTGRRPRWPNRIR